MSNAVGLLLIALFTRLLSLVAAFVQLQDRQQRKAMILAAIAAQCSIGSLVAEIAFPQTRFVDWQGEVWKLRDERHSIFAAVKVVDRGEGSSMIRFGSILNDGLFQHVVGGKGRSVVMFAYILEILLKQYAPAAQNILFLGLAAGVVPNNFPLPNTKPR